MRHTPSLLDDFTGFALSAIILSFIVAGALWAYDEATRPPERACKVVHCIGADIAGRWP